MRLNDQLVGGRERIAGERTLVWVLVVRQWKKRMLLRVWKRMVLLVSL